MGDLKVSSCIFIKKFELIFRRIIEFENKSDWLIDLIEFQNSRHLLFILLSTLYLVYICIRAGCVYRKKGVEMNMEFSKFIIEVGKESLTLKKGNI